MLDIWNIWWCSSDYEVFKKLPETSRDVPGEVVLTDRHFDFVHEVHRSGYVAESVLDVDTEGSGVCMTSGDLEEEGC